MKSLLGKMKLGLFARGILDMACNYFRIEIDGIENVPMRGAGLIVPNHSIWSGLDAIILSHILNREVHRIPRVLTLWNVVRALPWVQPLAKQMGLTEASSKNGLDLLRKKELTVLFPEGIRGSFKPSSLRYNLQKFHTGFVRIALMAKAPVTPCLIIGAEETQINFGSVHLKNIFEGLTLPVPFNLVPLPAKWKIRFLPQLDLSEYSEKDTSNQELMNRLAGRTREIMQIALSQELERRKYVYFKPAQLIAS